MLEVLFAIAIVGAVLYLIESLTPMAAPIKIVVRLVAILIIAVLLLRLLRVVGIAIP
jgi:hypothetical protein